MSDTTAVSQGRVREKAYELWHAAGAPEADPDRFWHLAEEAIRAEEAGYDKTLADSFPASDPPAHSGMTE